MKTKFRGASARLTKAAVLGSMLVLSSQVFAEPATKTAPTPEVPVSLSYSQLTKCFPELKNEAWTRKVDMNQLKEEVDRDFLTTQSLLRQREAVLKDPQSGVTKRLRLSATPLEKKKTSYNYTLTLEKLDDKGSGTALELPLAHRTNPEQKILNSYFVNQEILKDETSHFDTKLKGVTASYKKNFKNISEIELSDPANSRRLFCEQQKDLGVVCSCFSK